MTQTGGGGANAWQQNTQINQGQPGATALVGYRDALDARRTMSMGQGADGGRVPSAAYPDGYLGTIIDRRQDRLLDNLKSRITQRSYQRGVHKGERIDPADYYWPNEFGPQSGLIAEAKGIRWAPIGDPVEKFIAMGDHSLQSDSEIKAMRAKYDVNDSSQQQIDPVRADRLRRLGPSWK